MSSFLKKYIPFARAGMQRQIAYRGGLVGWFILGLIYTILIFFTWKAVYASSGETVLEGFTFGGMITYYLVQSLIRGTTFSLAGDTMIDDFKEGTIVMQLIKPINYRLQLMFSSIGHSIIFFLIFSLPYIFFIWFVSLTYGVHLLLTPINILLFLGSFLMAFMLEFLLDFSFGMIVYYTAGGFGMWQLKEAVMMLFSGALIPLMFYPDWLFKITQYLPFAYTQYVPISVIMGFNADPVHALRLQAFWIIGMFILTTIAWKLSTRKLVVQGG